MKWRKIEQATEIERNINEPKRIKCVQNERSINSLKEINKQQQLHQQKHTKEIYKSTGHRTQNTETHESNFVFGLSVFFARY